MHLGGDGVSSDRHLAPCGRVGGSISPKSVLPDLDCRDLENRLEESRESKGMRVEKLGLTITCAVGAH